MYGYNTITPAQEREALAALRSRGIARVEIYFSGGNDEGGADGVNYLDANGNKIDSLSSDAHQDWQTKKWVVTTYNREKGGYDTRDATAEEVTLAQLNEVLEAPIYDRWGSFAGEFYVDGTLTWDVASGTHEMHGQEQVSTWESF